MPPILVYTIKKRPKDGKYSLRDSKARLIDTFDTHAEAERYAEDYFAMKRKHTRGKLSSKDVSATRQHNGSYEVSAMVDNHRKSKVYYGHTKRAAIQLFLAEVNNPPAAPARTARHASTVMKLPMLSGTPIVAQESKKFRAPYSVDVWDERDRLHIHLKDADDKTIAEWWDEEARDMFELGFFNRRDLQNSVIRYAQDLRLI